MSEGSELEQVRASFERAALFMRAGDPVTAESVCANALRDYPNDGNILCLMGSAMLQQRRPCEAESVFRQVTAIYPQMARAHEGLGMTLLAQNNPGEAVIALERAVRLDPELASAQMALGNARAAAGLHDEADEAYLANFRLKPHREDLARAAELQRQGKLQEAESIYRKVLTMDPQNVDALRMLATVASEMNQFADAEALLKRCIAIAPDFTRAWSELSRAQLKTEQFEQAMASAKKALSLDPQSAVAFCDLGNTYSKIGNYQHACDQYRKGLHLRPNHPGCLIGLGNALKTLGEQEQAIDAYRSAVLANPDFGEAAWSLANLKTFRFEDAELRQMEARLDNPALPDEPRANFCFALGKAYEDRENYVRAFDYYEQGNGIRRMHESYDPVLTEVVNERIQEVFSRAFIESKAGLGHESKEPIMIVGLPRSGSTLLEQILASHSMVEGTQELPELNRVVRSINQGRADKLVYPEAVRELAEDEFRRLGQSYLDRTQRYRLGAPYFTDKMPNNFPSIGFLHLILPNARVIDARRHPLDSCLGCYKQLFAKGQPFTYDLVEIGEYYLQYRRMMDHWRTVLPGKVLDVHYEDMVREQQAQTRRLLEHCELPWEDQCLQFYRTQRAVNTASSEQVRQPIYSSSVHLWRRYEAQLEPLIDVLEPVLKKLPAEDQPAIMRA